MHLDRRRTVQQPLNYRQPGKSVYGESSPSGRSGRVGFIGVCWLSLIVGLLFYCIAVMRCYLWAVSVYASVQGRGAIALSPSLRKAYHLDKPGAQVEILPEDGQLVLIPKVAVGASQAWFWTDGWRAAEAEASRQLVDGAGVTYDNGEDFLADLP